MAISRSYNQKACLIIHNFSNKKCRGLKSEYKFGETTLENENEFGITTLRLLLYSGKRLAWQFWLRVFETVDFDFSSIWDTYNSVMSISSFCVSNTSLRSTNLGCSSPSSSITTSRRISSRHVLPFRLLRIYLAATSSPVSLLIPFRTTANFPLQKHKNVFYWKFDCII